MPSNQEPVEDYKMTDGFKSWLNNFKQLKRVQGFFQKSLQHEKSIMDGMAMKYKQLQDVMSQHASRMPQIKIKEIEGQDNDPQPGQMDYNAVGGAMNRNSELTRKAQ